MNIQTISALWALGLPSFQAAAQQTKEPPMPEPIARFWQKIAKAKTIAVTVKKWSDDGRAQDGKPRVLQLNDVSEVKIQRPSLVSIHSQPPRVEETSPKDGSFTARFSGGSESYVTDGKQAIRLNLLFHAYRPAKPIESLNQHGRNNPLSNVAMTWIFGQFPMSGLAIHTNDRSPQPSAYGTIYSIKDSKYPSNEEWYCFDPKTGDLMRWSAFYWDDKGNVFETVRREYQFWEFDPKLPKGTFDPTPPKNWKAMPDIKGGSVEIH